jgi:hypothetical protein
MSLPVHRDSLLTAREMVVSDGERSIPIATAFVLLAVIICFWFRRLTALVFMTVEADRRQIQMAVVMDRSLKKTKEHKDEAQLWR